MHEPPTALTGRDDWPPQEDPGFARPYIDADEHRNDPVPHRYVHGGFEGTDTRFSCYFPPADRYEGRFFQHVTPVPQSEHLAPTEIGEANKIGFSAASGAYFVETNGGGPNAANPYSGMDPSIGAYRANAAAARFSRAVARALYGEHRPYGYLYGGSGGGFRTIGAAENTEGVWDGFVPYVIGSPMAIPNVFTARMHAQRVLRDAFERIVDAYDAGGDPDALELTDEERAAFTEVTRMGFPPRSWFDWKTMGMHAFSVLYPGMMAADPAYATDFWTEPGYLGADPDASVHRDRIRLSTSIAELITVPTEPAHRTAGGVDESFAHTAGTAREITAIRLAEAPTGWALGAELVLTSGTAAGAVLRLSDVDGDLVHLAPGQDPAALAVGDAVLLDNGGFLAAQTYHRHQVPAEGYPVWDQFRDEDGRPVPPQRSMLLGPLFTANTAGTLPTGAISGKMIVVACLLDREAFPWQADWYRQQVAARLDDADSRLRLWYIDNALHGDDEVQDRPTRAVGYIGALQAALRQLAAWVENGVEPADTTVYGVADGQVHVPVDAADRRGVQPTVAITANGGGKAVVRPGEAVRLAVAAKAPEGGIIAALACDVTGSGSLGEAVELVPEVSVVYETQVAFDAPGTYFVGVRATAQAAGDAADRYARVHNVARARVVVE
jgi:hypothetical protein